MTEPRVSAVNMVSHPSGRMCLATIAKRTYDVRDGACFVADQQVALYEQPVHSNRGGGELHRDTDLVLNRALVDIIVEGTVRGFQRVTTLDVGVQVGEFQRWVRAFGERRCWRDSTGHVRFEEPKPIEEIELGWSAAYGGVDGHAVDNEVDPAAEVAKAVGSSYDPRFGRFAYPRNRVGRGYVISDCDDALERLELPSLEEPDHLLTPETLCLKDALHWPRAAIPAGFGYLPYTFFPRCGLMGLVGGYDETSIAPTDFVEASMDAIGEESLRLGNPIQRRFDVRVAQQSPIGMRKSEVRPGEFVQLVSAHPTQSHWHFHLSRERPKMMLRLPGEDAVELGPRIASVRIDATKDRVAVVWVGEHFRDLPLHPDNVRAVTHAVLWSE